MPHGQISSRPGSDPTSHTTPRPIPDRHRRGMATLADIARRLDLDWQRRLRQDPPRQRWSAHHRSLDVDPAELRRAIAARDDTSRQPLGLLVELAIAGDKTATLLVTLALLPRMVEVERRRHNPTP